MEERVYQVIRPLGLFYFSKTKFYIFDIHVHIHYYCLNCGRKRSHLDRVTGEVNPDNVLNALCVLTPFKKTMI